MAIFYGYLKNTDLGEPLLRAYWCLDCEHRWTTVEIALVPDPTAPGVLLALGAQLRVVAAGNAKLGTMTLGEQQAAARDHVRRQGVARREIEDRRIDREASERAADCLAPARQPGRNPAAPRGGKPAPPANPPRGRKR